MTHQIAFHYHRELCLVTKKLSFVAVSKETKNHKCKNEVYNARTGDRTGPHSRRLTRISSAGYTPPSILLGFPNSLLVPIYAFALRGTL